MVDYVLEGPKWGNPGLGSSGGVITWAVDASVPTFLLADIVAAFGDWSKYGNIQFQQIASIANSDIDFTLGSIDGLDNVLAQTTYQYYGASLSSAVIKFDSGEGWRGSGSNVYSTDNVNFFVVALHEIGHAIGLDHYNSAPAVMNAYLNPAVTDLRQSDIDGIHAIYGTSAVSLPPITSVNVSVAMPSGHMGSEWHLVTAADYNGDGTADLMWARNSTGDASLWTMKTGALVGASGTQGHMGAEWTAYSADVDFNHDGKADLLWTNNSSGGVAIWEMNGTSLAGFVAPSGHMGAEWQVKGVGDFNGDGNSDILWVNNANQVSVWSMNGVALASATISNGHMGSEWSVGGLGDFDGDGRDDIMWVSSSGSVSLWSMNGTTVTGTSTIGQMTSAWHIAGVADVTKDGTDDVVWVDTNNNVEIWQMKNGKVAEIINPNGHMGTEWHFASVGDVTGDGRSDLVWAKSDGTVAVWDIGQVSTVAALSAIDNFQFASSPEAAPSGPMQWVAEAAGPFNDTQTTTSGLDFASMDLAQNHDSLVAHALPFYHDLLT